MRLHVSGLPKETVSKHRTKICLKQVFPTFCKNLQCNSTFYDCNPSYTTSRTQNELSDKIASADLAKLSFLAKF